METTKIIKELEVLLTQLKSNEEKERKEKQDLINKKKRLRNKVINILGFNCKSFKFVKISGFAAREFVEGKETLAIKYFGQSLVLHLEKEHVKTINTYLELIDED
jgi:hypothetical protein